MDPIQLQKQVRDNAEDLRSYVNDLKNWSNEMKRKETLSKQNTTTNSQQPPPVRKKAKKRRDSCKESKQNKKPSASCNYSVWDKFDVEKACAEIDAESSASGEDSDVDFSKEATLREQSQYEKERGNSLVKAQKWRDAIQCYTRAIECYLYDPVFYANRALCYLHTKEYSNAESDCTSAIELDPNYVKAYHRRALARKNLHNLLGARTDLEKVLELEPLNNASKAELLKIKKQISEEDSKKLSAERTLKMDNSNSVKKEVDNSSLPENNKSNIVYPIVKPPHLRSKKPLKRVEIRLINKSKLLRNDLEDKTEKETTSVTPDNDLSSNFENVTSKTESIEQTSIIDNKTNVSIDKEESTSVNVHNITERKNEQNDLLHSDELEDSKVTPVDSNKCHIQNNSDKSTVKSDIVTSDSSSDQAIAVPDVPVSSVQFLIGWNKTKLYPKIRFLYLKKIPASNLPKLFQDSLEANLMSEVIATLANDFISEECRVYDYLYNFSNVRRFRALSMFFTKDDRSALKKLFGYCETHKECSTEELQELKRRYEM